MPLIKRKSISITDKSDPDKAENGVTFTIEGPEVVFKSPDKLKEKLGTCPIRCKPGVTDKACKAQKEMQHKEYSCTIPKYIRAHLQSPNNIQVAWKKVGGRIALEGKIKKNGSDKEKKLLENFKNPIKTPKSDTDLKAYLEYYDIKITNSKKAAVTDIKQLFPKFKF